MRVGLVIYGELDTPTGGYLYDRMLVEHLTAAGDDVEVISLPWRSYGRHLCDNASPSLVRRLDGARFDVLLQDELDHPSLVVTNRRRRNRDARPVVAVVHVLRASEHAGSRLRSLYAAAEPGTPPASTGRYTPPRPRAPRPRRSPERARRASSRTPAATTSAARRRTRRLSPARAREARCASSASRT